MKRIIKLVMLVIFAITVSACNVTNVGGKTVKGNGNIQSESRQVEEFDAIVLGGIGQLTVKQGENPSVTVVADENLLQYLLTDVKGSALELKTEEGININTSSGVRYNVVVPNLNAVTISGLGSADVGELVTDKLTVKISGSGDVELNSITAGAFVAEISGLGGLTIKDGNLTTLNVDISGSGNFDGRALTAQSADVTISGLGSATFNVEESLVAEISGSGSVNYYGNPSVESSITGLGSINRKDD